MANKRVVTITINADGKEVRETTKDVEQLSNGLNDLDARQARAALQSLNNVNFAAVKSALQSISGKLKEIGSQISGFGQRLTLGLSAPIAGLNILGLKFNSLEEDSKTTFKVFLKDGEKAAQLFKELSDFADSTPFQLEEVIGGGTTLLQSKIADLKGVLKDAGDLAAANKTKGATLADTSNAFARLKAGDFGEAFERLRDFGISREMLEGEGLKFDKQGSYKGSVEDAIKAVRGIIQRDMGGLMDEQSRNFSGQISTLLDTANRFLGEFTKPLFVGLKQGLNDVLPYLVQAKNAFRDLSPETKTLILIITGVATAIGPILVVLGTLITFVGAVVGAVGALIPIFAAVSGAFAGLSAFVVAFIGLIGEAGLVASFSALASVLGGTIVSALGAFLSALAPILVGAAAIATVVGVLIGVGAALFAAWQTNFGGLHDFTTEVFNQISQAVGAGLTYIQQIWAENGAAIISTATNAFNQIVEFIRPIMTEIVSVMREAWQAIIEVAGPLLTQLVTLVKTHLTTMTLAARVILAALTELWQQHGEQIKSMASAVWTIVKTIVVAGIRQIANVVTLVLAVMNGDWAAAWNAFKNIVQTGINATLTIFRSLGKLIVSALAFIATEVYNVGKNIVQGLINGIESGASAVYAKAKDIASNIIGIFRSVPKVQSPSRVTTEIGEFIAEGLAVGMENKESRVVSAAKRIAGEIIKQFRNAQREFSKLAGASPDAIRTIQQTNQISDATSAQSEIIKLRAELDRNNDLPLPSDVAGTMAELNFLQERKKAVEEAVPAYKKLEETLDSYYEGRAKQLENLLKLEESLEQSGALNLLNQQKENALLGITNEFDRQRIENNFEILRLRQEMTRDGYGEDQINEAVEIAGKVNAASLEWTRLNQIKKQSVEASKLGKDLDGQLESLQRNGRELSEYEKVLKQIEINYKDLSAAEKQDLLNKAAQIDAQKQFNQEYKQTFDFIRGGLDVLLQKGKSWGDKFKAIFSDVFQKIKKSFLDTLANSLTGKLTGGGSPSSGGLFGGLLGGGTPGFNPNAGDGISGLLGGRGGLLGRATNFLGFGGLFGSAAATSARAAGTTATQIAGSQVANAGSAGGTFSSLGGLLTNPWTIGIAGAALGAFALWKLFGKDKTLGKLKDAAQAQFAIKVSDNSVLKQIKSIGEGFYGKGNAAKDASATVNLEESRNVLRAYAERTNQSFSKIDGDKFKDENWSGNQFGTKFGGFREFGGDVQSGMAYVVGEKRPELFIPKKSGTILPSVNLTTPNGAANNANAQQNQLLTNMVEELTSVVEQLASKLRGMRPGDVVSMGAAENPGAVADAVESEFSNDPRRTEKFLRNSGQV